MTCAYPIPAEALANHIGPGLIVREGRSIRLSEEAMGASA